MAQIKLEAFGGMIPGTDSALLPPNNAAESENVWLYDGRLRPMRTPREVFTLLNASTRSVYRIPRAGNLAINIPSSYWLEFGAVDTCIIKSPVKQATDPAYYWAGDAPSPFEPRYTTQSRIVAGDDFLKLGVPAPLTLPTVVPAGGVSTITQSRAYAYTYLSRYNEEGPPSPVSLLTTGKIDDTWAVTLPAITAAERGDATKVITAITQATTAQLTVAAHGYALGDRVYTAAVVGMVQINNLYATITQIVDVNNFKVNVDSTLFTAYASGGTVQRIDRELTQKRIYRTVTSDQGVATYYFVAQVTIQTTSYNDTLASALVSSQGAMISQEYDPPTTLDGFAEMPNGMIIGWKDTSVYFCEPYKPWAWPAAYEQAVPHNIVGIGVVGQSAVICTEGAPYVATGTHPSNVRIAKINSVPYPCSSKGSIVATPSGVFYSSPAGVVLVGAGGGTMATAGLVELEDWQREINIARLNAAWLNGRSYYCFSGVGEGAFEPTAFEPTAFEQTDTTGSRDGAMIDFDDKRIAFNRLTRDLPVYNVLVDVWSNEVLIISNGKVYQIDISTSSPEGEYFWKSKDFRQDVPTNYGACRVFYDLPEDPFAAYTGTITFLASIDNTMTEIYSRTIPASGEEFRLPAGRLYDYYQIQLEGNLRLRAVHLATTMKELRGMV